MSKLIKRNAHSQSLRAWLRLRKAKQFAPAAVVVLVVATLGVHLLTASHAATPYASTEAESGTLAGGAAVSTDSTASGGKAVTFASGTSTPAYCKTGGAQLWANLETCGWPGPSNTGPDLSQCPGGVLTTNSGSDTRTITISTNNAVVSCENITGGLEITAQNVTIENDIISYDGNGAGGTGVININDGANATVNHVETNGLNLTHACIWDEGAKGTTLPYSMVAEYVNCHDVNDGIFSWWWSNDQNAGDGSDFSIENSYFHDFTEDAANGHIDGYQTEGAQNGLIEHNTYNVQRVPGDKDVAGGGLDSAIAIWDDYNESTPTGLVSGNFTVEDNLITGGGFAAYAEDVSPGDGAPGDPSPVGGNSLTNVHFINNVFSTYYNGCVGDYGVWFYRGPGESASLTWPPYYGGPTDGWNTGGSSRSGNTVLETGEDVDNSNPHVSGVLCT